MSIRTRKLKSGRTVYDVELRRPDGTKYGRRFNTKLQAKDWQAEQRADRARDTWVDPVAGRINLRDYAKEWLDNRELAPRTREIYASQLKHILAAFGDHSLNAITKRAVRSWNTKMRREVSPQQAAKCYRLLMAMLNTAAEDDVIGKNRCRIKGAAQERTAERPLVPLDKALELAATIDRRYRALVLIAAGCGLRMGELLALTRADVDLLHGKLRVDKQKQELSNGHGIVVRPPKTEAGNRPVSIPSIIVAELEEHLSEFVGAAPDAPLFLGPRGGQRRARVYEEWHKAVATAGLRPDLKPHDLRHLHNTLAAKVPGVTLKDLMAQMGHKSEEAAVRYLHATADAGLSIAAGLDAALRAACRAADAGRMPDGRSFRHPEQDGTGL